MYSSTMKKTSTSTHRQRYHLPPAFECQDCKKTFSENTSLTRHLLSHTHSPCLMCNKTLNQTNIRRHIKKVHNNLLSGIFKVSLCLLCLDAECAGACNGREFRRGKTFVLESATKNALQYLGVSLSQKSLKVMNGENPKIEVTGKMRQVCESKDKLAAFVKAVQNATSYEYVKS